MNDFYKAPGANLDPVVPQGEQGSIADALAGNYSVDIGGIFKEAWAKTQGNKLTVWLGILLMIAIIIPVAIVTNIIGHVLHNPEMAGVIAQIIRNCVSAPLEVGVALIGVNIACLVSTRPTEVIEHFGEFPKLIAALLLKAVLLVLGIVLCFLPFFYLLVCYSQVNLLIVNKGLSVWDAFETARKAVTKHWFEIALFYVASFFIMLLSIITIIGWIWALPMILVANGILFRTIFGYGHEGGIRAS